MLVLLLALVVILYYHHLFPFSAADTLLEQGPTYYARKVRVLDYD